MVNHGEKKAFAHMNDIKSKLSLSLHPGGCFVAVVDFEEWKLGTHKFPFQYGETMRTASSKNPPLSMTQIPTPTPSMT